MSTTQIDRQRIYTIVDELPPSGLEELSLFLDYLKFKHEVRRPERIVALGGLWKDVDFDVSEEDVRNLRQRVTAQILKES